MESVSKELNKYRTKCGYNISVNKFAIEGNVAYEITSELAPPKKMMLYIHGGPNLSCEPYILDTINGEFRSVENFLKYTNIIFIDQKKSIVDIPEENKNLTKNFKNNTINTIIETHNPKACSDAYFSLIEKYLYNYDYGIFAQSFGAQTLLHLLKKGLPYGHAPKYISLSSPFLGVSNQNIFLKNRRKVLYSKSFDFKNLIKESSNLKRVFIKAEKVGLEELLKHKLSKCISHPSHPAEIISRSIENEAKALDELDEHGLISYCEDVGKPDLINFIIGSQYFTPGSNIYKETLSAMFKFPYPEWMPDEAAWLKYAMETQYPQDDLLQSNFIPPSEHVSLQPLINHMMFIPTFIYFDPDDFMIPYNYFTKKYFSALDEWGTLELRQGYGHWVGHSSFTRILGEVR